MGFSSELVALDRWVVRVLSDACARLSESLLDEKKDVHLLMARADRPLMAPSAALTLSAEIAASTPYEHVRAVGKGGHADVVLVRHKVLGSQHVMKVIRAHDADLASELTKRLLREGRVVSGLKHPNIVQVSDFGFTSTGRAFMVAEYVDGKTLKQEIAQRGPLPILEVIAIGKQILSGLDHAHTAGVVHRDIKPDNIMLLTPRDKAERGVKILDFGIVKIVSEGLHHALGGGVQTAEGILIGSPAFMAPEQVAARPVDVRTDLYALGATLFYLLTSRQPFLAADLTELLKAQLTERPCPPSQLRSEIPGALDAIVLKALEKDPSQRFQSAAHMRKAFEQIDARAAGRRPVQLATDVLEVKTTPLPAEASPAPPPAMPVDRGPVDAAPLASAADFDTLFRSSPLEKELKAKTAQAPPPARTTVALSPKEAAPRLVAPSSQRPSSQRPSSQRPSSTRRGGPPRSRWFFAAVVVFASIVFGLAVIGLLRVLGIDR